MKLEKYKSKFNENDNKPKSGDILKVPIDFGNSRGKNTLVTVKVLEFADKQEMMENYFVEYPKGYLNLLCYDTKEKTMVTNPDIPIEEIIEPNILKKIARKYSLKLSFLE